MRSACVAFGFLLWSALGAAQQYVISTYAGGAPAPTPASALAGSIGAPISVATDAAGNAYFASPDLNCVFKLDRSGVLTRVAGTSLLGYSGDGGPATSARLQLVFGNASAASAGLAVDSAGNLFIADTSNHRIRRVSPDGVITTVAGNGSRGFSGDGGTATSAELNYPWAVAVDGAGNLFIADAVNYLIRKVSAGGIITTVAGGGTLPGASADGGSATRAQLSAWAVAADSAGNLFIADDASGSIRKVSPSGIITTVAPLRAWGVAVDGAGNLFLADGSSRIRKVAADGTSTTVAGGGTAGLGDGGPATSAQLSNPAGVGVDGAGNLFIADRLNNRIRKVSPSAIITTVAGDGTGRGIWSQGGPATDGGPATSSQLSSPWAVALDGAGNLFIADSRNHRIRRVSPSGNITTVAGNGTWGFSGDGGPATSAQLNWPLGVAVDNAGNLFAVDAGNGRVRKVSSNGIITTVTGNGLAGNGPEIMSGDCNRSCSGVAVDGAGNLFIADSGNSRIRKVSPSGIITTVPASSEYPNGVAVDGAGNLFIAESGRVRKVSASGIITTVAGGGQLVGSSADGGLATNAQLSFPYGLAVDGAGNLFFADPGWMFFTGVGGDDPADHRIRKVSPSGLITTVAGTGAGQWRSSRHRDTERTDWRGGGHCRQRLRS